MERMTKEKYILTGQGDRKGCRQLIGLGENSKISIDNSVRPGVLVEIRNDYDDIIVSIYIMYVMCRISDDNTAKFILYYYYMHYGFCLILISLNFGYLWTGIKFLKSLSYGVIGSSMLWSFGITP